MSDRTSGACSGIEQQLQPGNRGKRLSKGDEITRSRGPEGRAGNQPLEVVHRLERLAELASFGGSKRELLDRVEAVTDALERRQRPQQPGGGAARPSTLRCDRFRRAATFRAALAPGNDLEVLERSDR